MRKIPINILLFSAVALVCLSLFEPQKANSQATPNSGVRYETVSVSAIVPISEEWSSSIARNSTPKIKEVNEVGKKTLFTLEVTGVEDKPMRNQFVQAYIVSDTKQIAAFKETTDKNGIAQFEFTPRAKGQYKVFFTNDTYEEVIEIENSLTIEIPNEVF